MAFGGVFRCTVGLREKHGMETLSYLCNFWGWGGGGRGGGEGICTPLGKKENTFFYLPPMKRTALVSLWL